MNDDCKIPGKRLVPDMLDRIIKAVEFAKKYHGEQKRKYTADPYIIHPIEVALIVATVTKNEDMIIASILHDVLEDTTATKEMIVDEFGPYVADLVEEVSDVSRPEDGNRAVRKAIDREHLAKASAEAQTIKLADLINNSYSIVSRDPGFAPVYLREKQALLVVLTKGDPKLYARAVRIVKENLK